METLILFTRSALLKGVSLLTSILGFWLLYNLVIDFGVSFQSDIFSSIYFLLCLVAIALSFLVRVARFRMLCSPWGGFDWLQASYAMFKASALNNLFPARLGDIVRIFYCKKELQTTNTNALAIIVFERTMDFAICIILSIPVAHFFIRNFFSGSTFFIFSLVFLAVSLAIVTLKPLRRALQMFGGSFIKFKKVVIFSILLTALIYGLEALGFWLLTAHYQIEISFFLIAIIVGAGNIATVLLPSPAGFGPFEFAVVYLLNSLVFIDNKTALTFALCIHMILIIPTTVIGLLLLLPNLRSNARRNTTSS